MQRSAVLVVMTATLFVSSLGDALTAADQDSLRLPNILFIMTDQHRWKYNYYPEGYAELYDLQNDPREMKNLADDPMYREVVFEMKDRLLHWLTTADETDQIAPRWLRP